ncbi:hypothetical protein [Desulfobacula phenolica]|uniref:Uncharacterized protein n=1 Tax=Desulfobacula phenolica TaxID=90732 RepID=A0A1H2H5T8_9BACT|nr:hypothetical protein [Desulfobacula phenolica]SDU27247.1 hypothetical protein SAMN04487931_10663 [Desulfobacula phenolica]
METMAGKIRALLTRLSRDSEIVTAQALAWELGLITREEKLPMYGTLKDMRDRGELIDTGKKGEYRFKPAKKKYLRTVMWRLLRARQIVTVEDLMELAGVSEEYAKEWLRMLTRQDIVKQMKAGVFKLVADPVVEPLNTDRAERLRDLRKRKKAMAALDKASKAIDTAKKALSEDQ